MQWGRLKRELLCAVLYVNAMKDFTKPLHRELPARCPDSHGHNEGAVPTSKVSKTTKTLNQQLFRSWATHHYNMPSWPLSSGSCCILVPHCSWWFWRPVEWVPDSCMTVTSTPLHVHPHGLQQWGLEMKHVSNLILRSMAGVWEWD